MGKSTKKRTPAQKAEKKRRQEQFMTIFVGGKMKRVPRPATIDFMSPSEFILQNADPIWLHQNELWEYLPLPDDATEDE